MKRPHILRGTCRSNHEMNKEGTETKRKRSRRRHQELKNEDFHYFEVSKTKNLCGYFHLALRVPLTFFFHWGTTFLGMISWESRWLGSLGSLGFSLTSCFDRSEHIQTLAFEFNSSICGGYGSVFTGCGLFPAILLHYPLWHLNRSDSTYKRSEEHFSVLLTPYLPLFLLLLPSLPLLGLFSRWMHLS